MPKHADRKLFLFGRYSLAVLPPKKWLTELGLKRGDGIHLELDKKRGRIIIRLDGNQLENISNSTPTTRQPKKKTDDAGWEPIPQL